jgi:hypothetical protein
MNYWPSLSSELEGARIRTISHGGGVQTSALCLMAARGEIGPMPDVAIMADTGGESAAVYDYLEYLRELVPFPIVMVRKAGPSLAELSIAVATGKRSRKGASLPPWFTVASDGKRGMMPKHCSGTFKRDVVLTEIRRLLGFGPGQRITAGRPIAECWLGISKDEIWRVQSRRQRYIQNRYPLIEMDLTRDGCIKWLQDRQYRVPPKSSCVYCPYRTNAQWRFLRDHCPDDFAEAIRVDGLIRGGSSGHDGHAFVHRSFTPLAEADLADDNIDQAAFPFAADCDSCGL